MLRVHFSHSLKSGALPVGFLSTAHALDDNGDGLSDVRPPLFGVLPRAGAANPYGNEFGNLPHCALLTPIRFF